MRRAPFNHHRHLRTVLLLLLIGAGASCGLPHDADGTLDRVKAGHLRVGIVVAPPWLEDTGGAIHGVEAALIQAIAADVGAQVTWVRAPEALLMQSLHKRQLDLVAGGLTADLPWASEVAFTRPFANVDGKQHVLAAPPGENAWLVRIERVVERQRPAVGALMAGVAP
jgi:polar amino acid transport system substrate-binding protein